MKKRTAVIRLRIPETLLAVTEVKRCPGYILATVVRKGPKKSTTQELKILDDDLIYLTKAPGDTDFTILRYIYSDTCVTPLAKLPEVQGNLSKLTRRPDGKILFVPTSSVLITED